MAKVILVAKCLARERKQLETENLKWSELHKKARASTQKNTARIKDLLCWLEITCMNLLAENKKALRELVDSKMKYIASCQLVASLEKENEQLRARLEP
jgi:GTP cyclohydrolase II